MKTSVHAKNKRFSALALVLALLVLAVAVPVTLIFDRLGINIDMTPNSLYTLTDTTRNYLADLDARGEVVDVYFLMKMEELEDDLEVLALYRTLLAYDAYDCFNLIDFDPDTDPGVLKEINPQNKYNLGEGDFLFVHGDMVKRLPASLMYTYKTDQDSNVTDAEFRAENYFTGYMKTVVEGELPIVYFLTGHGETPLSDMTKLTTNLANNNYGSAELNLTTTANVPDDCCILVIAGPQYDISEPEYDSIVSYINKGGNVSMLISPNSEPLSYKYLERILSDFCIGMNYDRVSETDPDRHSYADPYAFKCNFAAPSTENDVDLTTALAQTAGTLPVYMPYSRSFYSVYGTNYSLLSVGDLLVTETSAEAEPWGGTQRDPESVTGRQLSLAMYAEDPQRDHAKVVVFGSADIITDAGTGNAYFIQPLNLFLSSVTWMYNSDIDMNIEDKARTYDALKVNSSSEATLLMGLFIGFPIVVAAAGIFVWLRRKNA